MNFNTFPWYEVLNRPSSNIFTNFNQASVIEPSFNFGKLKLIQVLIVLREPVYSTSLYTARGILQYLSRTGSTALINRLQIKLRPSFMSLAWLEAVQHRGTFCASHPADLGSNPGSNNILFLSEIFL